jgi:3-dehydroquinate synthase
LNTFTKVHVPLGPDAYEIIIGGAILKGLDKLYAADSHSRAALITSDNIAPLHAAPVREALRSGGWDVELFVVPDGEAAKDLTVAGDLCRRLAQSGCDRGAVIFALGGGVIGDLAGFVAAIYLRGITFVQLPTTLLAQADASVGGKVAVDLPEGKNLIGAFHQPDAVFIDTSVLGTLPDRYLRSGMAEVIKHAAIADEELFSFIEDNIELIYARDPEILQHLLARNCQIKVDVVTRDPRDTGVRSLLNLGHTIGHAVEAGAHWAIHHGEAVAIGMVAETRLAVELGICGEHDLERLEELLATAGLRADTSEVDTTLAVAALRRDKKIANRALRLPLMTRIGKAELFQSIDIEQLEVALLNAV